MRSPAPSGRDLRLLTLMKRSRTKHKTTPPPPEMPETLAALASGMADDFNNILTTVMGACSVIDKDDPANIELLQCVALIRVSAERAAALSDKLMRVIVPNENAAHSVIRPHNTGSADTSVRDKKSIHDIVSAINPPDGVLP